MTASAAAAASRPLGPGNAVWLASYPKSGNTWVRAILTAIGVDEHLFEVNHLRSGSQPYIVSAALPNLGLDPRWLDRDQLARLRAGLICASSAAHEGADGTPGRPVMRKTHEKYRSGRPWQEPFPLAATRAALLVVRDPRDVACSYAPFFGVSQAEAVRAMAQDQPGVARPARMMTEQPWGSWSAHGASWLAQDVPFPVHVLHYEDLHSDPVATLLPALRAVGMDVSAEVLANAVARTQFDRLARAERASGFRETSRRTERFFRRGRSGTWREELPVELAQTVVQDHGRLMTVLGYDITAPDASDAAGGAAGVVPDTQLPSWSRTPPHLGLTVRPGTVPAWLPGARRPRPWIQVTSTQALLRFASGAGMLVRDGHEVIVELPDDCAWQGDASWLVQGWAVTLAMLQRGQLSLHAATVVVEGVTLALAGRRGAGKSTTSMGLRSRGHQLLVDDVTLVEFADGRVRTTPYARNVHLLPDSAEALGLHFDELPLLAGGRQKAAFTAEEPPVRSLPLDAVVVLRPDPTAATPQLLQLRGAERIPELIAHTRRDGIAPLVLGDQGYFQALTKLAAVAPVFVLRRPLHGWSLDPVLDLLTDLAGKISG